MKIHLWLVWFFGSVIILMGGFAEKAKAQEFPADNRWLSLPCEHRPIIDRYRDQSNFFDELDLVGDLDAPAGQLSADNKFVYFRFRLDKSPKIDKDKDPLRPFAWGIELGKKEDPFSYKLIISVNGKTNQIEVYANSTMSLYDSPGDLADLPPVRVFPFKTHGQVKKASGSEFGGDDDYWLSMAVPWTTLKEQGIEPTTALLFWVGSSTIAYALDGDLACHDGSHDGVAYLSKFDWDRWIVLVDIQDSDGDGYPDEFENEHGTDPHSPSSYPHDLSPPNNRIPKELILEGGGCSSVPGHSWQVENIALLMCLMVLGGKVLRTGNKLPFP